MAQALGTRERERDRERESLAREVYLKNPTPPGIGLARLAREFYLK